jgi:lipid-A-disaccharide synthase
VVQEVARTWPVRPVLIEGALNKYDAFAASAAALTKSGTSTLELALALVPMLVTYRVNPISARIAKRLITVRHAALVNLLADLPDGGSLVPELIQQDCTPAQIATRVRAILNDPVIAAKQRAGFSQVLETLHPPGGLAPSEAAAEAILRLIEQA